MNNLEKTKNILRGQKQNRDKTEEELDILAIEKLEKDEILKSLTFGIDIKEKEFAFNLLKNYFKEFNINSFSKKDTIRQLIDTEILIERIKKFLNTEYAQVNPSIPISTIESLNKLIGTTVSLKNDLEIENKKGETTHNRYIPHEVKLAVWKRAKGKCEKCGSTEMLELAHIIDFALGGSNSENNLYLGCFKCNHNKKDNIKKG